MKTIILLALVLICVLFLYNKPEHMTLLNVFESLNPTQKNVIITHTDKNKTYQMVALKTNSKTASIPYMFVLTDDINNSDIVNTYKYKDRGDNKFTLFSKDMYVCHNDMFTHEFKKIIINNKEHSCKKIKLDAYNYLLGNKKKMSNNVINSDQIKLCNDVILSLRPIDITNKVSDNTRHIFTRIHTLSDNIDDEFYISVEIPHKEYKDGKFIEEVDESKAKFMKYYIGLDNGNHNYHINKIMNGDYIGLTLVPNINNAIKLKLKYV